MLQLKNGHMKQTIIDSNLDTIFDFSLQKDWTLANYNYN